MHPSPSLELCRTYFTAANRHQHCYAFVSSSSSLLPLCKHVKPNFVCVGLKKGFLYILACFLFIRICVVGRMKTRADDNSGSAMEEATLLSVAAVDTHKSHSTPRRPPATVALKLNFKSDANTITMRHWCSLDSEKSQSMVAVYICTTSGIVLNNYWPYE